MGRVSRAHGIKGEVRVVVTTDNPERFVPGAVVYAGRARSGLREAPDGGRSELRIEQVRGMEDTPIVAFAGVTTREAAESLRGCVLQVHSRDLPALEEGEYYSFDLEGLAVRSLDDGEVLGRVTELLESPAHDLLVVGLARGGELLVPFTHEVVPVVSLPEGYLVVDVRRVTTAEGE